MGPHRVGVGLSFVNVCGKGRDPVNRWTVVIELLLAGLMVSGARATTTQGQCYAHPAKEDAQGVVAPWYEGLND